MGKGTSKTSHNPMFFFLFLSLVNQYSAALHHRLHETHLLLSFKASVSRDPSRLLSNWVPSVPTCRWNGITCSNDTDSGFSNITAVNLSGKNITATLSDSVFRLPHIQILDLSDNQFVGELPWNMFDVAVASSSLLHLNLSNNNFTGPLPTGGVSVLQTLDLSNNMISGSIPKDIGLLFSDLQFLDLGGNVLTGEIPNSVANLKSLEFLTLASNKLSGEIPTELGGMKRLRWIYLGYNNLSGQIPEEIGQLGSLNHLDLVYNKLTGKIPESFGNLTRLQYLFLYQNGLTGKIPPSIFRLVNLISLDLSDNSLSGEIPELVIHLQRLEILHLFGNNFTGKIPRALASLPCLQILQLWSNGFSGEIPEPLGRRNNLTILDVSTNFLTGKIPDGLCDSKRLFKLILFSNSLTGEIPRSLCSCQSLRRVRLQHNRLSGELCPEFTKLPLLYFLDISGNQFSGRIDGNKWDLPSLQMMSLARNRFTGDLPEFIRKGKIESLDFSANEFSGSIPESIGRFSELMELNLSNNNLAGRIPSEISSCKKLVSLDLSHNQLIGEIPVIITQIPVLSFLDLSENELSGEIPPVFGRFPSLVQINISHNHFYGALPSTGAFLDINASAVAGNDLCGGDIITSKLPACENRGYNHLWWFMLVLGLAALFIATAVLVTIRRRKLTKIVQNDDGIWEVKFFDPEASKLVTVEAILSSAEADKSGILVGTNEVQFVVVKKWLAEGHFWNEVEELGRLRHPNVVRLLGACRSEKAGYLVREYVRGQYLSEAVRNFTWERRRNIALGIAGALQFLHPRCSPGVIAANFSPEKIIVDEKHQPRLLIGLSTTTISPLYFAPEAKESRDITEKSNVYTLGLILIQLVTGKGPVDRQDLVEWARYCYSDCHTDTWVDSSISGDAAAADTNQIVGFMNLALNCTAGEPMARPSSQHAYKTLLSLCRTTCCSKLLSS
ncbi:probably inactive leucine-rich repeat receptor-like protein kinase At2g25790 isoform X2 [Cucurbita pepo subsp. pepo]|uniref:probably inactive leucine-rich repeat receptor-like protein kinase At2g25790 isoform X2 n=1 Tax=Cucurbita pepo subsp. pepo TaxID=3664 RepID=UPI000C9D3E27|nr:probably inactive leucine-rich repeat receptor-like protein kinase At2g25790 isoform X2 [Cucurbita pepo subsp. pepo]